MGEGAGQASAGYGLASHRANLVRLYILESASHRGHHYTGLADDLRARLKRHNAGEVRSTARYAPWELRTYIGFDDPEKAVAFERYLKSPSGRSFAKKRL